MTVFALAAGVVAATASAASALPSAKISVDAVRAPTSGIVHVDDRDYHRKMHHRDRGWHRGHGDIDWNDGRYSRYRGWHQFHSRPHGWRSRGCVAVGPIWFCP